MVFNIHYNKNIHAQKINSSHLGQKIFVLESNSEHKVYSVLKKIKSTISIENNPLEIVDMVIPLHTFPLGYEFSIKFQIFNITTNVTLQKIGTYTEFQPKKIKRSIDQVTMQKIGTYTEFQPKKIKRSIDQVTMQKNDTEFQPKKIKRSIDQVTMQKNDTEFQQKKIKRSIDQSNKKEKRQKNLCTIDSCDKKTKGKFKVCASHGGGYRCKIDNCDKHVIQHNLCHSHGGAYKCILESCNRYSKGKMLCYIHKQQIKNNIILKV
jgi:hypothetical protein